jgi:Domain of unknown function (DUF1707)
MAGPQDAAGRGRLRVGRADREQVIDSLKDAFTQGRPARDELDARTGQALASTRRSVRCSPAGDDGPADWITLARLPG